MIFSSEWDCHQQQLPELDFSHFHEELNLQSFLSFSFLGWLLQFHGHCYCKVYDVVFWSIHF